MVNPELRKRFVDSIEYLRKMDFFRDYPDLSSEEILEKIFGGEMNYEYWWKECSERSRRKRRRSPDFYNSLRAEDLYGLALLREDIPRGVILRGSLEEYEDIWIKKGDAQIDYKMISFDTKRTVIEDPETALLTENLGITMLKRLARISREVFQPTNINSRWMVTPEYKWAIQEVSFDFEGERYGIQIVLRDDYLIDIGLKELNKILKDTRYQYYQIKYEDIIVVMLTEEEAEKLRKERGWEFVYLV